MTRGRPSRWDELDMPSKLDSVRGWAMNGSTDEEIAKMLGISTTVLYEWKKDKSDFAEAIKKGKDISNGELLNSAFRQSTGFFMKEQVIVKLRTNEAVPTADGKGIKYLPAEKLEIVEIDKFVPANPTMNIFMLKNRIPSEYKDKRETELTGKDGAPIQIDTMTPEQRKNRIAELVSKYQK